MCSIAGIIGTSADQVNRVVLERMNRILAHRGPDGSGYYFHNRNNIHVGLAHNRLAILDLSEQSAQPLACRDRYHLVFNGEIYNYKELRDHLKQKGYEFRSTGDTEVVAAAFDAFGPQCLSYFDGMFSLAIWDPLASTLFCARDRFGEKPFYYHYDDANNQFSFSSEIKGLFEAGISREVDYTMLYNFLTLGWTKRTDHPQRTFYNQVFQLPPSHYLIFKPLEQYLEINRYWDLDKETEADFTEDQAFEKFLGLLQTSVERRLRSDVPIGTSLSGGLDSSSIAALVTERKDPAFSYRAFSAVFPGFEKDESANINAVAAAFNLELSTVSPDAASLAAQLEDLVRIQEEPFGSASVFAQYRVYEEAKKNGVKVLLDGQGADEILGGYTRYTHWYLQELLNKEGWRSSSQQAVKFRQNQFLQQWGIKNFLAAKFPSVTASQLEKKAIRQQEGNAFMDSDFAAASADRRSVFKPTVEKLNDILYFDTMTMGLEELLRYADRNSMANGVEVRLPYLSYEWVQFVFSLGSSYKMREGFTKWILRKTMWGKLPENICWQKGKTGFEPPQKNWMKDPSVQDLIRSSQQRLVDRKICNKDLLNKPILPTNAHDADNFDFRTLVAGIWIQ